MPTQAPVHIGNSGWHYTHWRGPFYPDDLGEDRFLACRPAGILMRRG